MCTPPPGSSSNPMELKYPRLLTALLIRSAGRQRNKLERRIKAMKKNQQKKQQAGNQFRRNASGRHLSHCSRLGLFSTSALR